jgi:hypothetical protein
MGVSSERITTTTNSYLIAGSRGSLDVLRRYATSRKVAESSAIEVIDLFFF